MLAARDGGINNKNFDLGDAYKGATTDALTKIGSYMGVAIDVYKGEQNPSKVPAKGSKDSSKDSGNKWLNKKTVDWNNAVSKKTPIDTVKKHYRISKDNEKDYLELIK